MVGVIDGFRWCLLGGQAPLHVPSFLLSAAMSLLLLLIGVRYFRSTERGFADLI
jgi:lipopolysaccharide transport system permease protein